jgi:hypothetical protein
LISATPTKNNFHIKDYPINRLALIATTNSIAADHQMILRITAITAGAYLISLVVVLSFIKSWLKPLLEYGFLL